MYNIAPNPAACCWVLVKHSNTARILSLMNGALSISSEVSLMLFIKTCFSICLAFSLLLRRFVCLFTQCCALYLSASHHRLLARGELATNHTHRRDREETRIKSVRQTSNEVMAWVTEKNPAWGAEDTHTPEHARYWIVAKHVCAVYSQHSDMRGHKTSTVLW